MMPRHNDLKGIKGWFMTRAAASATSNWKKVDRQ